MMPKQADAVLKYAKKWADEKYKEGPNNDTVFGKWIGLNNQPWCCAFVVGCFSAARVLDKVTKTASCQTLEAWARKHELVVNPVTVQAGDVLLYDFHNEGKSVHVGIATGPMDVKSHKIPTVEGNTVADTAQGSQVNGDGVYYKKRLVTTVRVAFRPKWDE